MGRIRNPKAAAVLLFLATVAVFLIAAVGFWSTKDFKLETVTFLVMTVAMVSAWRQCR